MVALHPALPQRRNPIWYRAIKAYGRLAQKAGLAKPLSAEHMIAQALRRERRHQFADTSFCEGLEAFVAAANSEARLNGFGRLTVTGIVSMALRQRLKLEAWREAHPEIDEQRIVAPLIIVGLPRTGTTFLHQLLYQDPQFRSPLRYEIEKPVPPPKAIPGWMNARVRGVQLGLDVIHSVVPHFMAIHPMAATYPDEDQQITQYQFSSIGLQHIIDVPSYQQWLLDHDFTEDLRFHKRFLQHLQSGWHRDAWLLKSPAHVQYLPTLLEIYPDARIIHTHRDPQAVMGSVSSLSWVMQDVLSDYATPRRAGEGQLRYFSEVTRMCLRDREALGDRGDIFDLRFTEFVAEPMAMVSQIYAHFGLQLSAQTEQLMLAFIAENKKGKRGDHSYDPAIFGVDGIDQIEVFQRYRQRFGV